MPWFICLLIGMLGGCAVGLPCYYFGWYWRGRLETSHSCLFRHRWGRYEETKEVTGSTGQCEVGQRRECTRCAAVDYRRVIIHN